MSDPPKRPKVDPIAAANAIHARRPLLHPREIQPELIAYDEGAIVLYGETGSADAHVVRDGEVSYLTIDAATRGTPRAVYSVCHELAHHCLHRGDYDQILKLHGGAKEGREHRLEHEANRFASHLLVPTYLAAPRCLAARPSLAEVRAFASDFNVSLTVAALRWSEVTGAPCAFVESRGGVVKRASRSSGFRAVAVLRRPLEEGTLALEITHGARAGVRVHERGAWGSAKLGRPVVEESLPVGEGAVLTWLAHE